MTLYELTAGWRDAMYELEMAETDEERETALAELDGIDEDYNAKAAGYAMATKNLDGQIDALDAEIKRLTTMKKRKTRDREDLFNRMKNSMIETGKTAIETPIGTWKIGKGRESVQIIDAAKVPQQFLVYADPTVSKTAVMDWYKETGEVVPGTDIVRNPTFGLK